MFIKPECDNSFDEISMKQLWEVVAYSSSWKKTNILFLILMNMYVYLRMSLMKTSQLLR